MKISTPPLTRRPDAVSRRVVRPAGRWTVSALAAAVLAPALMLAASGWLSWTTVWRTAEAWH